MAHLTLTIDRLFQVYTKKISRIENECHLDRHNLYVYILYILCMTVIVVKNITYVLFLTSSINCSRPNRLRKSRLRLASIGSSMSEAVTFRSKNTVKPSFSQKCSKFLIDNEFPVQLCIISWIITLAKLLSPTFKNNRHR